MVTPRLLRSSRRPAQALPKEQPWARTLPTPESIAEEGVLAKSGLPQACHWERDQERLRPLEGRAEAEWGRGWGRGPRGARGAASEGAEAGKAGGTAGLTEVSATGTDGGSGLVRGTGTSGLAPEQCSSERGQDAAGAQLELQSPGLPPGTRGAPSLRGSTPSEVPRSQGPLQPRYLRQLSEVLPLLPSLAPTRGSLGHWGWLCTQGPERRRQQR